MKIIPFPDAALNKEEWVDVAPEKVIAGHPRCAYRVLYTSRSGEMSGGIYECTAGKWHVSYTEDEFCALTTGTVRLTSENGETQEFSAPQSFMIPSGYKGTWEAVTNVRKFFVVYEKSPQE